MKIEIHEIGLEGNKVVMIDDALPRPEDVRELAAGQTFAPVTTSSYPGVRRELSSRVERERAYVEALRALVKPVMQDVFDMADFRIATADLSLMTLPAFQAHPMTRIPHYDEIRHIKYALLHFLAPVAQGGTAFYRHRRTGFERISPDRKDAFFEGLRADLLAYGEPAPRFMSGSDNSFEQTACFEGRCNRLLIYSGALLHTAQVPADFTYSADPAKGRLTANLFLVPAPTKIV